jgi:hypothetical protein
MWHDGVWVAVDAGSYSYADELHPWFAGSASHNGIMIDGEGQLAMAGRFTWIGDARARLTEWDPARARMVAWCDAWRDVEMRWEREVSLAEAAVCVVDRVAPTAQALHERSVRLHWLLGCSVDEVHVSEGPEGRWTIDAGSFRATVSVRGIVGEVRDCQLKVEPSQQSWYYGALQPATSVVCLASARGVAFETRFDFR